MHRLALTASTVLVLATAAAGQTSDDRMVVEVPPMIADQILTEMRQHMDTLDDVMAALAAGDFLEAAEIAETRMDFGHRMGERMAAAGASPEEIRAMRERMRELGWEPGQGQGMGPGRFLPEDFRAMGQVFHEAAQDFAATARAEAASCAELEGLAAGTAGLRARAQTDVDVNSLDEPLATAALVQPIGVVGEPLRTAEGTTALVMVCARTGASAEDREAVVERLRSEQLERLASRYLRNLRQEAFIDVRAAQG